MKLGCFITITNPLERGDLYDQCVHQAEQFCDVVTVIDGRESWPEEFRWPLIGHHFQAGYASTDADWVLHLDTDFIIHEKDFHTIRKAIRTEEPALSMYKYQFVLPDRYNLKSRLVTLVNKGLYGDRIRFDGGGDLCQPTLDGKDLINVPESGASIYNYEKLIKNVFQVKDDVGRMARAWERHFGEFKLGGPDDESAFVEWLGMQIGRFAKPQREVPIDFHPEVMRDTILNLSPKQFGYDGFGYLKRNNYVV